MQWQCIDCSGTCSLDEALAEHVEKLVKAKEEQDQKDQELRQAGSPQFAAMATSALIRSQEEAALADKLASSARKLALDSDALFKLIKLSQELKAGQQHLLGEAFTWNWRETRTSAEQLLHQNADPSSSDRLGHTALMCAADKGHLKVVEVLLSAGAQVEARSDAGETALTVAATSGHLNVVRSLVLDGAEPEACNANCLIEVARRSHLNVLKALPKEVQDERGRTALVVAARKGHSHVVDFLVRAGAKLEAHDQYGYTALMSAAFCNELEVAEVLIKAGAQLDAACSEGTALTLAADYGHLRVVEALLRAGAQLEARDETGKTALIVAAMNGRLDVVEALLEAGAQLEARDKQGSTALIWAACEKHQEVVTALVLDGAEIAARGADGFTALTWAVSEGQLQLVNALLKAGAHAEALDKQLAEALGHSLIADIL